MEIKNEKELVYMMQFLGIKTINLDNYLGKVILNDGILTYSKKDAPRYYTNDMFAIKAAMRELGKDVDDIRSALNCKNNVFDAVLMSKYKDSLKPVKEWVYLSDIKDSGVEIIAGKHSNPNTRYGVPFIDKGGDALTLRGTIDQLRQFLSYANNHLRYCNGYSYTYDNKQVENMFRLFKKYNLFKPYDSFSEYYHGGIVD